VSDEVLAKLGAIKADVSQLKTHVSRIDGKVDVLQTMVSGRTAVEVEHEVRNTNRRNAAIGAAVVKWVGSGGLLTALVSWGGTQFHEHQKEQSRIEATQRAQELEQLKRQLITEQKRAIDESAAKQTQELEASRDSSDNAGARGAGVPRNRNQRSNR